MPPLCHALGVGDTALDMGYVPSGSEFYHIGLLAMPVPLPAGRPSICARQLESRRLVRSPKVHPEQPIRSTFAASTYGRMSCWPTVRRITPSPSRWNVTRSERLARNDQMPCDFGRSFLTRKLGCCGSATNCRKALSTRFWSGRANRRKSFLKRAVRSRRNGRRLSMTADQLSNPRQNQMREPARPECQHRPPPLPCRTPTTRR